MPKTEAEKREDELDAEARKGLRDFPCNICGEVRNLLDFYDEVHEVWFTKDMGIYIDHGEATALKRKYGDLS